jgi:hypothetical protein
MDIGTYEFTLQVTASPTVDDDCPSTGPKTVGTFTVRVKEMFCKKPGEIIDPGKLINDTGTQSIKVGQKIKTHKVTALAEALSVSAEWLALCYASEDAENVTLSGLT